MTRVKPVIAAQKRKKSPPRRNGNGLRQMDTRTQFTSRVEPRQEQRRCNRGRRVERAPAFQADTGQGYDELEQAHETTYGEFKAVRDDLHRLWKVKSCVDTAARFNERTEEQKLQNRPQTRQKKEELSR